MVSIFLLIASFPHLYPSFFCGKGYFWGTIDNWHNRFLRFFQLSGKIWAIVLLFSFYFHSIVRWNDKILNISYFLLVNKNYVLSQRILCLIF